MPDATANMTAAQWYGFGSRPAGGLEVPRRCSRAAVARVLAGGQRLTAREIATALNTNTRAVHQVVCKFTATRPWISRERPDGSEYVYFLTPRV